MNPEVTTDILHLIQREITVHFHAFDVHPELITLCETKTLADLRAFKGMWTPPNTIPVAPGAWRYQANKCSGCMLARIASKKEILRDLRIVLWSRTDDYNKYSLHKLMAFVDDCINQFNDDEAEEIFATVINLAHEMKAVRQACNDAISGKLDAKQIHERGRNSHHVDSFPGNEPGRLRRPGPIPTSHQSYHLSSKADNEGDEAWGDLPRQIDHMIEIYNGVSLRSPHSKAKLVPEAMVANLDIPDKEVWMKRTSRRDGVVGFPRSE
jgi:hypothetical protein